MYNFVRVVTACSCLQTLLLSHTYYTQGTKNSHNFFFSPMRTKKEKGKYGGIFESIDTTREKKSHTGSARDFFLSTGAAGETEQYKCPVKTSVESLLFFRKKVKKSEKRKRERTTPTAAL
uniref:Uncharacterized protein n=1 Tax=Cacopsylla melanoneura TaxID=428564 RepID=A0A8D8QVQ6_9HEMI